MAFGRPTNLLCPPLSLVYSHWTEGSEAGVAETLGVALALLLGVAEVVGDDVGFALANGCFALANGLGAAEKPPSPMLTERAAIAAKAIRTPIVPLLKVGFGWTFGWTFGPLGRLVLPPLRWTGGFDDNV